MRIWALILLLLTCVIGFAASYGFAYRKVTGIFYSPTAVMESAPAYVVER